MTSLTPDTLIARAPDLLATEVDGETVLMDVASGKYFGLARTAQAIWAHLESPIRFDALCTQLQRAFSGPESVIQQDTRHFVLELARRHLVTLT